MSSTSFFPCEEFQEVNENLQSRLYAQYKEWFSTKATLDQAVQAIARIKRCEVYDTIYTKLQETMHSLATRSEEIRAIMADFGEQDSTELAPPSLPNAEMEQTPTVLTTNPRQRPNNSNIAQIMYQGFYHQEPVANAVEKAEGNKEIALNLLVKGIPTPQIKGEVQELQDPYLQEKSTGQSIVYGAVVTPSYPGRKAASSSFITATPTSPAPRPVPPVFSSAAFSSPTTAPLPSRSTHSPCSTRLYTRKSSMPAEEKAALFTVVQKLAPFKPGFGSWKKVVSEMTSTGFVKEEAAWKGEWSRYGTYEQSFDERKNVFVSSEKERLRLLRCLDRKPKAEVKQALEELEEEELVEARPAKRQKMVENLIEVDGGFVMAGGEILDSSYLGFSGQEYVEDVEYIAEAQVPEVDAPISFDVPILDGAGFGLEDGSKPQIADKWIFSGVENGPGVGANFELDFGGDLGIGYDTSYDGGYTLEAFDHGFLTANNGGFRA